MQSFRDASAQQRYKVFRRLYTEINNWSFLGEYEGGEQSSYQVFNPISVPTIYKIECAGYWNQRPADGWKPSKARVRYYHNPDNIVIKVECEDYWSTDGDWDDLIVQFIVD
ncbi:hypothetical protein [Chryseobacterium sp. BIGb0232]|uniref:hypothetical protein n=1 Tax=Chryseobacterium sp. BIGb0232 TaxID=2940598 RepID=UPI0011CE96EC|nr:hypothetical protein [Chryseobacterium sp. BIGb0232]MCS4301821.1 hypothetical protein [Chryseobacterium sp. BIGb0232]